jgi:hypothetical protein
MFAPAIIHAGPETKFSANIMVVILIRHIGTSSGRSILQQDSFIFVVRLSDIISGLQ